AYSTDSQEPSSDARLISKRVANQEETASLDNILSLTNQFEDILGVTTNSDESNGVEADISNMEIVITASPTPTLRIHKDHPKSQIIGPLDTPIQTRNKSKEMDIKSAFLYGTIDEKVYVMQPPRFQDPEFLAKVYKVEKAMYGLHQAPRAWYGTLSKYLLKNGFQKDVRSSNTHMDKENPWGKDGTGKDVDLHLYRSMVGSLMYLTASRPDIMFADHKSTTGGCQFLGRRLISWQCKKQTIVATSTTVAEYVAEGGWHFSLSRQTIMATSTTVAEYVAAASCCGQVPWIQNQLLDYGLSMPCKALSWEFSTSILHL
nr:hypothetical protein [Tanacetum cinerariifolium]